MFLVTKRENKRLYHILYETHSKYYQEKLYCKLFFLFPWCFNRFRLCFYRIKENLKFACVLETSMNCCDWAWSISIFSTLPFLKCSKVKLYSHCHDYSPASFIIYNLYRFKGWRVTDIDLAEISYNCNFDYTRSFLKKGGVCLLKSMKSFQKLLIWVFHSFKRI